MALSDTAIRNAKTGDRPKKVRWRRFFLASQSEADSRQRVLPTLSGLSVFPRTVIQSPVGCL